MLSSPDLKWEVRMMLIYRSEKKRIVRNQIELIEYLQNLLAHAVKGADSESWRLLVLKKTDTEELNEGAATCIQDKEKRQVALDRDENEYWFKRLINSEYLKDLFALSLK